MGGSVRRGPGLGSPGCDSPEAEPHASLTSIQLYQGLAFSTASSELTEKIPGQQSRKTVQCRHCAQRKQSPERRGGVVWGRSDLQPGRPQAALTQGRSPPCLQPSPSPSAIPPLSPTLTLSLPLPDTPLWPKGAFCANGDTVPLSRDAARRCALAPGRLSCHEVNNLRGCPQQPWR